MAAGSRYDSPIIPGGPLFASHRRIWRRLLAGDMARVLQFLTDAMQDRDDKCARYFFPRPSPALQVHGLPPRPATEADHLDVAAVHSLQTMQLRCNDRQGIAQPRCRCAFWR